MNFSRVLIMAGVALICLGALAAVLERFHLPFGRLPGDISWRGRHTTVYFPWVTCLVISAVATLILWIVNSRR